MAGDRTSTSIVDLAKVGLAAVVVLIIIFELAQGAAVKKMGIPGLFEIELDPGPGGGKVEAAKEIAHGTRTIPVSSGNSGQALDLDNGSLLVLGTSQPAGDADLVVRQAVHGVVLEPGLSHGDGLTFDARFVRVADKAGGHDVCADAAVNGKVGNILTVSSDVQVGSHVCMVTNKGRLAEFEITKTDFAGSPRSLQMNFVTWEGQ